MLLNKPNLKSYTQNYCFYIYIYIYIYIKKLQMYYNTIIIYQNLLFKIIICIRYPMTECHLLEDIIHIACSLCILMI